MAITMKDLCDGDNFIVQRDLVSCHVTCSELANNWLSYNRLMFFSTRENLRGLRREIKYGK